MYDPKKELAICETLQSELISYRASFSNFQYVRVPGILLMVCYVQNTFACSSMKYNQYAKEDEYKVLTECSLNLRIPFLIHFVLPVTGRRTFESAPSGFQRSDLSQCIDALYPLDDDDFQLLIVSPTTIAELVLCIVLTSFNLNTVHLVIICSQQLELNLLLSSIIDVQVVLVILGRLASFMICTFYEHREFNKNLAI